MTYAVSWYRMELSEFSRKAKEQYDSKVNETELNSRQLVQDAIKPYMNEIINRFNYLVTIHLDWKVYKEDISKKCN